jgi:17beta-estradiol 17-dehydrogenase / very-long-chain 3-oxoacyl-CoA reductase
MKRILCYRAACFRLHNNVFPFLTFDPCHVSYFERLYFFDIQVVTSTYNTFLRPAKNLNKYGKWAVVTGATDGIGKAYAIALAKHGMSVVLVSRTESKLKDVQQEIIKIGVEAKYIVCDYSKFDDKAKATIKSELDALEIGVLINNVGMSYRYPRYFHELPDDEVADLQMMNIDSTVWMTRMVLPGMVQRKKGAIVNVSSASADYTLPLLAMYGGAKSFVEKFSRAINAEYRGKGITCQSQMPFYVATKLAKLRKSATVPTPEEYVACAMKWVGYPDAAVSPFWIHAVQGWVMKQIPDYFMSKIIMDMHMGIRKRGLKKDESLASGKKD